MDKRVPHTIASPNKRGFALIITLSVLSAVIALSMVLLSYFSEVQEDSDTTKALIQADVYYADILEQLSKFKDTKSIFSQLYVRPVFLRSPEGKFSLTLGCKPIAAGMNVNWLAMEHENGKYALFKEAQRLFDTLAQDYNLEDPDRLLEMLLLEIDSGKKFIKKEQSRLIQKKGIISYQQFSEIISRYEMEADDLEVSRVPWSKYFIFSETADKINATYSSAELLSFLFDIDLRTVKEWQAMIDNKPSLQVFVNENGGNYEEKRDLLAAGKFLDESHCKVNFGDGYTFTFDYIRGEAKYFEFYGKH